ncbi:MAG: ferrous iron transport protein B [Thermoguttaceae bacterium]|jgi:ferrous iron transport protein B
MPATLEEATLTVALIGNPNTGKSTLFGALVGIHQHVGNYPGVTVEKKIGRMEHAGRRFELVDLPGLYSLAARSRDEMVAVEVLLQRQSDIGLVDVVICIVDGSNLERHLYLVSQVLELGLPTVVAVNMLDVAATRGIKLELRHLQSRLGVAVVPIQANRGLGLPELKAALIEAVRRGPRSDASLFPEVFEKEVHALQVHLATKGCHTATRGCGRALAVPSHDGSGQLPLREEPSRPLLPPALVRRLLLDASGYFQNTLLPNADEQFLGPLHSARVRVEASGCPIPAVETTVRYAWARSMLQGVVSQPKTFPVTVTDRIDRVLTHRVWGLMVFAMVMLMVFQSVFVWARPLMDAIGASFDWLGGFVESLMPEGALRSLLAVGVIGGVGGVVQFLPQILILFTFIALLEDCGYMARAAYLMDRVMVRAGLSGRSFIPMLSSFACAVPGIMAARVIENERDRLTTILVAPLLTCSARLPVYALLIAAFVPQTMYLGGTVGLQGLSLASLYVLGIVAAVTVALVLKRTILRGATPPFVMEMPSYKWPSPRTVLMRVMERAWIFLRTAGSLILAISIVVWAAAYYPHDPRVVQQEVQQKEKLKAQIESTPDGSPQRAESEEKLAELDNQIAAKYQQHSVLGLMGKTIEPVVRPLGWDWRIGCAVIASFPAREVVVATLGVVYGLGKKIDTKSEEDRGALGARLQQAVWDGTDRRVFTLPVALSLMVFFALCAQCAATLAVIRRETNSWRWPVFSFTYMTGLAYIGALVTYQVGTWLRL